MKSIVNLPRHTHFFFLLFIKARSVCEGEDTRECKWVWMEVWMEFGCGDGGGEEEP